MCLLVLVAVPDAAVATTVVIKESVADAEIDLQNPNQNRGVITTMSVESHLQGGQGRDQRILTQFSLAGIPAGSTILSATLELHMVTAPAASRTYSVHQVMATPWTEGGVTWNNATGTTPWTAPGGDFDPTALATVTSGTANGVWLTWDVTSAVVAWYASPATNLGFLVKDATERSTTQYRADFATRENSGLDYNFNPARALKPRLSILYRPPDLQISAFSVDASVFSSDVVTISMTVTNNGGVQLDNVQPSALAFSGTATPCADPIPAGSSNPASATLGPATSATFAWTCQINGVQDQTYAFTGQASGTTAGLTTVTAPEATTNAGAPGRISIYTVSDTPTQTQSVGLNVQVTFTINNGLTTGTIDWLNIFNPNTAIWQFSEPAWQANDTSGWTKTVQPGANFRFVSPNSGDDIPAQGSKSFTITFDTVADPGVDTVYTFNVTVKQRGKTQDILVQVPITVRIPTLEIVSMTVDSTVASGATARIVMTVRNRGSGSLTNVTPSSTLTASGTAATKAYASGPTPPSVTSLSGGASTSFVWTYTITGTVDQTYAFAGSVLANGGNVTAGPTTTNTGRIASYGLAITPASVTAGQTNVQIRFTVTNALATGTVDRIRVTNPNSSFWITDAGWAANNATNWTTSQPTSTTYQFASPSVGSDIPPGNGTKDFIVTFASVGDPGLDTSYTFNVSVHRRGDSANSVSTITGQVTVSRYALELVSVTPSTIAADGVATSEIKVRLVKSGVGQVGEALTFTTTPNGGTFPGDANSTTASTTAGTPPADAIATAVLTSAIGKGTSTATVTISFASLTSVTATVTFTGIAIDDAAYLTATAGSGAVTVYWQTPPAGYSDSVVLLRRAGTAPTETLADGTVYTDGQTLGSSTLFRTANTAGTHGTQAFAGLTNGTKYFYKIFSAYKDTLYSETPLTLDATPTDGAGGRPTWTYTVASAGTSLGIPLTEGSNVFAARGRHVFALDAATGAQQWIRQLGPTVSVEGWVVPWPRSGTGESTLYFGGTDGKVYNYALDGTELWVSPQLGDAIQATVSPQSWDWSDAAFQSTFTDGAGGPMDVVFVATRNASATNNKVYALRGFADAVGNQGGTVFPGWTFTPGNMDMVVAVPTPTVTTNEVFVASYAGGGPSLWRINALTGGLIASKTGLGDVSADPWLSFDGATLYVGTRSSGLVAVDAATLATRWTYPTGGQPVVGFVWEDWAFWDADPTPGAPRRLYFATQDGKIHAIDDDGATASAAWAPVTVTSASTPLVDDMSARKLWVGGGSGRLHEIDLDTGTSKFAVTGEAGETLGDPAFDFANPGQILVGSSAGRLHAVPIPLP
jgi:hypothetical protein